MKKLLFILLFSLFGITTAMSQKYSDVRYQYMELSNSSAGNFVDFKLTYDNYTGNDNCKNNIQIFAQDIDINIYFQVYLDDVLTYSGWAKLPAWTNYYLDDAFYDCNSSRKNVLIKTQTRYE